MLLLGDGGVGKTALRLRYMGFGFQSSYLSTIGADFALKEVDFKGQLTKMQIWDLAGQQHYQKIRKNYYIGTHAVILVYDVTRQESFQSLTTWIKEIKANIDRDVPIILVGNKTDLRDEIPTSVSTKEGFEARDSLSELNKSSVQYIETSAKTGDNVEQAFKMIIDELLSMYA